jgi:hypothetical protein
MKRVLIAAALTLVALFILAGPSRGTAMNDDQRLAVAELNQVVEQLQERMVHKMRLASEGLQDF